MRRYIEHLQKKPEHVRRRILFIAAPLFTFLIATAWLSAEKIPSSPDNAAAVKAAAPSEIFEGDLKSAWGGLKGGIMKVFQGK